MASTTESTYDRTNESSVRSDKSRLSTIWISLSFFLIVSIALLLFIAQNSSSVEIKYLGYSGSINFGVALLLSAVIGSLLTVLIGSMRIAQVKHRNKRTTSSNPK